MVLWLQMRSGRVTEFEEKPEKPSSNLASMGIYIFSWKVLKEALDRSERAVRTVTSASISFLIAKTKDRDFLHMSIMATGKT